MITDGIRLEGVKGTWYEIDRRRTPHGQFRLLESEQWGDELPCIIVDSEYKIIELNAFNSLDEELEELGYL